MVKEYIYSPHYNFYIDKASRTAGYDMRTFHIHKKYEIYYQVEGPRQYFIEDSAYLINAGNVVLIGPDSVHKTGSIENMPHTRYVLNFHQEYLQEIAGVFPSVNFLQCFEGNTHVLQISPKKQAVVEGLLFQLWEQREAGSPETLAGRKMRLAELLLALAEYAQEARARNAQQGRITNKTIDAVQSYISTHYTGELSLSAIAAKFYISPYYLSRLFKRTTNLSIVEYINSVRLMAAKKLLEKTELKIAMVGEEAGFSTTTHFSRIFKEGTGLSPQQYRKLYKTAQKEEG